MPPTSANACARGVITHYNEPGSLIGATLADLMTRREVVAIQGDRILFDLAPLSLPFDSRRNWRLPKGPFVLGLVCRAPIVPVFVTRAGWRRYRLSAHPHFNWPAGRVDKTEWVEKAARWWSGLLAAQVRRYWDQWFVFEPAFHKRAASSSTSDTAPQPPQPHAEAPPDEVIPAAGPGATLVYPAAAAYSLWTFLPACCCFFRPPASDAGSSGRLCG
jgi:hypothetical protein